MNINCDGTKIDLSRFNVEYDEASNHYLIWPIGAAERLHYVKLGRLTLGVPQTIIHKKWPGAPSSLPPNYTDLLPTEDIISYLFDDLNDDHVPAILAKLGRTMAPKSPQIINHGRIDYSLLDEESDDFFPTKGRPIYFPMGPFLPLIG